MAYYFKMNDHPFLLYQACMRPYSFYDTPLLYTLKLDSALLFIYNFIIIIGNVYLFLFLQSKTENNTALNSVDKKKERKRNFVSAKSGIICGFVLAISTFVYSIFYGLKVHYTGSSIMIVWEFLLIALKIWFRMALSLLWAHQLRSIFHLIKYVSKFFVCRFKA